MLAGSDQDAAASWSGEFATRDAGSDEYELRLARSIDDLFMPDDERLDDRLRHVLNEILRGIVGWIEADIRLHASHLLRQRGIAARSDLMQSSPGGAEALLRRAGVLRDSELMGELIARVRLDLLGSSLPRGEPRPGQSSLLIRLTSSWSRDVRTTATALLAADNRRRSELEDGTVAEPDLPEAVYRKLVWLTAVALRAEHADADQAIVDAAARALTAYDGGGRAEAVAARLADAIDARPADLASLLAEALEDGRVRLFVAFLAHALELSYEEVRDFVLERRGDRIRLAMRAIGLDGETIARVAAMLAQADPACDLEALASELEQFARVTPAGADAQLRSADQISEHRTAVRTLKRAAQ